MQNKKLDCVLLSVPVELLAEAGIEDGDVIQMYSENGKITISAQKEPENFVCDGICKDCPFECICEDREVF